MRAGASVVAGMLVAVAIIASWGCGAATQPPQPHAHRGPHPHGGSAHAHAPADEPRVRPPLIVDVDKGYNPWTNLEIRNDPSEFQFMIVTDRTGFARRGVFESAMDKINLMLPEFVVSVGDLIEGYTVDEGELRRQWDEIDGFVDRLQMPFFYLAGNHDYGNEASAKVWKQRLGRSYYYFVYRDVLFLALNTMHAGDSTLGGDQVEWAKQTLARFPDVRWTIVLMHHPLFVESETQLEQQQAWQQIETVLAGRKHTVFAGHLHRYTKYRKHSQNYYVLATTGGGSTLRGPSFGEFDQAAWITMTPQGPRVANLLLDGILPDDIYTAEQVQLSDRTNVSLVAYTDDAFERGGIKATVVAANATDRELTVDGQLDAQGLQLDRREVNLRVAPKSEQRQDVLVKLGGKRPSGTFLPATLRWTARFDDGERTISGSAPLALERRFAVEPTKSAIEVDGVTEDWGRIDTIVWPQTHTQPDARLEIDGEWDGADDLSFDLAVAHDEHFLYLRVSVTDDHVRSARGTLPWSQDGLLVRLDARAQPNGHSAIFRDHLLFLVSPGEDAEPATFVRKELLPKGTAVACRKRDGGYVFEARVPLAYLDAMHKAPWQHFRLNVRVFDQDTSETISQLYWRPDWTRPNNYWDSGMFYKRP